MPDPMPNPMNDGFTPVPAGKVAAVVTVLEMTAPPPRPVVEFPSDWRLERETSPDLDWYRDLYRRIGEEYLWYSRLALPSEKLAAMLGHEDHVLLALTIDGQAEGMVEMDFREAGRGEIVFFGVTEKLVGTKAARAMMTQAIDFAFGRCVGTLWLHTNTLDHARALAFYRRSGFVAVRQEIEIADDPRLTGIHPREAAPQVALFER